VLEKLGRCDQSAADEIIVCGRRNQDRYRLPELGRREPGVGAGKLRGEAPRASAEVAAPGGCGIFQHQRRCSRAEMEEAGYFRGRDPVSFLGDLVTMLVDPDARGAAAADPIGFSRTATRRRAGTGRGRRIGSIPA
jgi:hypothetical protein